MVDSDFDEDDYIQNNEMDEIFSLSQPSDEFDKDNDSDLDTDNSTFFLNQIPNALIHNGF